MLLSLLPCFRTGRPARVPALAQSRSLCCCTAPLCCLLAAVLPDVPDVFEPPIFNSLSLAQKMAMLFPPQDPDFAAATCAYLGSVFWMPRSTLEVSERALAVGFCKC